MTETCWDGEDERGLWSEQDELCGLHSGGSLRPLGICIKEDQAWDGRGIVYGGGLPLEYQTDLPSNSVEEEGPSRDR